MESVETTGFVGDSAFSFSVSPTKKGCEDSCETEKPAKSEQKSQATVC